jgi:DNA polymerase-3 subunit gamma/tau
MVGQEHVLKALTNALSHDRLHHAYLFTGTRGVGKTTVARIFAKSLNCEQGVGPNPCGQCSACVEITEGRFVDLIEVDAASRTKVEDTRELLENVQYSPSRGRFKVYIIDEVHMLSTSSFNALLKTLEEPPEHVKFLLATTDPQKLPVTVLSRCLQFNLKNMSPERIVNHLKYVLDQEKVPFEEPALWLLAKAADGSMRDALSLTDQSIAFGNESVMESDVRNMLGTVDRAYVLHVLEALAKQDAAMVLDEVARASDHAPDFAGILDELIAVLHRIAVGQMVPGAIDNSQGDQDYILGMAQAIQPHDVHLFYQIALASRKDMAAAADQRAALEMTLLRMLAFQIKRPGQSLPIPEATLPNGQPNAQQSNSVPANGSNAETASSAPVADAGQVASETPANSVPANSMVEDKVNAASATEAPPIDPPPFDYDEPASKGSDQLKKPEIEATTEPSASVAGLRGEPIQAETTQSEPVQSESIQSDSAQSMKSESIQSDSAQSMKSESVEPQPDALAPAFQADNGAVAQNVQPEPMPYDDEQLYPETMNNDGMSASEALVEPADISSHLSDIQQTLSSSTGFAPPEAVSNDHSSGASGVNTAQDQTADSERPEDNTPVDESSDWLLIERRLKLDKFSANLAANMVPVERGEEHWHFILTQDMETFLNNERRDNLANALSEVLGKALKITVEPGSLPSESPAEYRIRKKAERLQLAITTFHEDKHVVFWKTKFGGQVLEDTVVPID